MSFLLISQKVKLKSDKPKKKKNRLAVRKNAQNASALIRVHRLLPLMTDVHQVERLKTNLEYWLNLNEDSFSYYLSRQKEIILAKDAAESVSFDFFRDDLENAKKTCKLFLNSFDDIVELTPDFENFTNKVSRATLQFSYYLATTALIFPDGLKTSLSNFQKLLDDYLNSLIKMKGNLILFANIYFF